MVILLAFGLQLALAGPYGPTTDTGTTSVKRPVCDAGYPYELEVLPEEDSLYWRVDPERSYAASNLIHSLREAAGSMAARFPDVDRLFVGDISARGGGNFWPHRTHNEGLSADIGLYHDDGQQPDQFFQDIHWTRFDYERNWELISALLDTGEVAHILMDAGHIYKLKSWLLENNKVSEEELQRIFPTGQPLWKLHSVLSAAPRHRNHMHVQFRCERPPKEQTQAQ